MGVREARRHRRQSGGVRGVWAGARRPTRAGGAMSPAVSAVRVDSPARRRALDRALISGDESALRGLGVPCPAGVLSGDIGALLTAAGALSHPLHSALRCLTDSTCTGSTAPDVYSYVAAVAVLHAFLRVNFVGPAPPPPASGPLAPASGALPGNLALDGEEVPAAVVDSHLLLAAETVLVDGAEALARSGLPYARWWAARASMAHHAVLARATPTLHARIFGSFHALLGSDSSALATLRKRGGRGGDEPPGVEVGEDAWEDGSGGGRGLRALAHVELCMAQQEFHDAGGAVKSLARACALLGMVVPVRGQLGVRTKFQQTPVSQLVARVFADVPGPAREPVHGLRHAFPRANSSSGVQALPLNVPLNDSEVLGYVKLVPAEGGAAAEGVDGGEERWTLGPEILNVTPVEQAAVLAHASVELSRNASHDLTDEQAAPFVARVLSAADSGHGSSSVLQVQALLLRTRFERERGRYLERNMSQMEAVNKFVNSPGSDSNAASAAAAERLALLFASGLPPRWELRKELAVSFGRLGLVKSAMEIFHELECWDELVDCHRLVGNVGAAKELVQGQLDLLDAGVRDAGCDGAAKASAVRSLRRPRLLCVLGDVTRDAGLYEQAWEESGARCGRAKRSLGRMAVEGGRWEEAVLHLRQALKLNPLFPDVWFTCGCASIEMGDMQAAAACFTHVVQETPENGEAWNNLGRVLCELGRHREGLGALLQAGKNKRQSWRIWDNVLQVATALKASNEIVAAMGNLIELRGKEAVSAAPLAVAVEEVIRMATAPQGGSGDDAASASADDRAKATQTCRSLLQLLARATTLVSSDAAIWAAYARLHDVAPGKESRRKSADCRQRQIRTLLSRRDWTLESNAFRVMASATLAFATAAAASEDGGVIHAAALHTASVIMQTQDSFGTNDAFEMLREARAALGA
jgi:tetratricopeptide (TPR) repeat protein